MTLETDFDGRQAFEFSGNAREYFGIWIVNLGLSIVTLGIYSAWAKVRNNQYFYRNTKVADSTFDYTADPKKILKGRLIAVAMLLGYQLSSYFLPGIALYVLIALLLMVPLIYQSSIAFRMRYSQWRNISFSFERNTLRMYLLFLPILIYLLVALGGPLLFGISPEELEVDEDTAEFTDEVMNYFIYSSVILGLAGLLFPLWQCFYYNFVGNRTNLGNSVLSISLKARSFYGIYFTVGLFGVFWALVLAGMSAFFAESLEDSEFMTFSTIAIIYLFLLVFYVSVFAFIKSRLTNLIYSAIRLDGVEFESTLKFTGVAWLYMSNTLAILLTLGMAIPWAKVRLARYRAEHMFFIARGEIDIQSKPQGEVDAGGDAMSDIFDFDIGL